MFEDKARQVPRRHHIGELYQSSAPLSAYLSGRGGHGITVHLGMMLAVTFADNQHDMWTFIFTAVYGCSGGGGYELVDLLCSKRIGVQAEDQSINRLIENGMFIFGQSMFHFADITSRHQSYHRSLVMCRQTNTPYQNPREKDTADQCRRHDLLKNWLFEFFYQ